MILNNIKSRENKKYQIMPLHIELLIDLLLNKKADIFNNNNENYKKPMNRYL